MRWLLLPVGLGIAALAAWLLLSAPAFQDGLETFEAPVATSPRSAPRTPSVGASPTSPRRSGALKQAPTRPHIDDASRRQLDELLEREGIAP